ncbi:MAG: hypothetical protein D6812_02615 [Deltaproteobacteria bacterium]|nr:MAG: hypothetical protein D6812_02615 [Deltaproteobacteria bacterium]
MALFFMDTVTSISSDLLRLSEIVRPDERLPPEPSQGCSGEKISSTLRKGEKKCYPLQGLLGFGSVGVQACSLWKRRKVWDERQEPGTRNQERGIRNEEPAHPFVG